MRTVGKIIIIIILCAAVWFAWQQYQDAKSAYAPLDQGQIEEVYDIHNLPAYSGDPAVEINGGRPDFAAEDLEAKFFEKLSSLDDLGRCGAAEACLDRWHMPEGERGEIETIRPSGWQTATYDFIDNGGFLFNRCHLIGWQLTGRDADRRNLITGTRYMNVEGMLPYENEVAWYLRHTRNHVRYRVTPVFQGKELVARGVQIEAQSVEDGGKELCFNVFCYNVQPNVEIDYTTGESKLVQEPVLEPAEQQEN